jgi:hypothetical protein
MANKILTQDRLKELYRYAPDTGYFYRRKNMQGGGMLGQVKNLLDKDGYVRITIDGRFYFQHRLAFLYMEGILPPDQVDHINHIRPDNRWSNLRHASAQINARNQTMSKDNTSGAHGVYWRKDILKWTARIVAGGLLLDLGCFQNKANAIAARKAANQKYGYHPNHGT